MSTVTSNSYLLTLSFLLILHLILSLVFPSLLTLLLPPHLCTPSLTLLLHWSSLSPLTHLLPPHPFTTPSPHCFTESLLLPSFSYCLFVPLPPPSHYFTALPSFSSPSYCPFILLPPPSPHFHCSLPVPSHLSTVSSSFHLLHLTISLFFPFSSHPSTTSLFFYLLPDLTISLLFPFSLTLLQPLLYFTHPSGTVCFLFISPSHP